MSNRKSRAWREHQRAFSEQRALLGEIDKISKPVWSAAYWKELSRLATDLEHVVFSRPRLRWNRHAETRYRRALRSRAKTTWQRYVRLRDKKKPFQQFVLSTKPAGNSEEFVFLSPTNNRSIG